jgi:hypothetical protein
MGDQPTRDPRGNLHARLVRPPRRARPCVSARSRPPPILGKEGTLPRYGGSRCLGSGGKGGLDGVPHGLEQHAAMGLDPVMQKREVAINRVRHRLSVPLPARGAAFAVGEEEGDGAGGEFDHVRL